MALPWWLSSFSERTNLLPAVLNSYDAIADTALFKNGNLANEDFGSYSYGEQDDVAGVTFDPTTGSYVVV